MAVELRFADARIAQEFHAFAQLTRSYGPAIATQITRRLAQLRASAVLADMQLGNCHPLKGDRQGQYAVDVGKGRRLVFVPADEPLPTHADGGIDLRRVTTIQILSVEDYHG